MKKAKLFTIALVVTMLVMTQFAMVSAAPPPGEAECISGSIETISIINEEPGKTIVEITLIDESTGEYRTVQVTENNAYDLGLLEYDGDGNPLPVASELWPDPISIPVDDILPAEEEAQHPVGNALAVFFADLPGVDYNGIMAAHKDGYGFGVIAQALWLTQKMEGDSDVLAAILEAKETGDYSAFTLEDGTVPSSWGQFKKAILDGDKKTNLGVVMSGKDKDKDQDKDKDKDEDKDKDKDKDKDNNGNNGNDKVKDKVKDKDDNGNNGNKDNDKNKP